MRGSTISYKDFIKLMEDRGYILRKDSPVEITEFSPGVRTFPVKNGSIGKFLEIECLHNTIMSACGKNHPSGCNNSYSCNVKCFDEENKEPFQEFHQCIPLTQDRHTVTDIVVTKILQKDIDKSHDNVQEWSKLVGPILKVVKSEDPYEYPMWTGNYKLLHNDFLKDSFNLYSGEKMIFYTVKPDIDIVKVCLEMKVDILEYHEGIHL